MKLLYTLTSYLPAVGGAQTHQHLLAQQIGSQNSVEVVSQWDRNRTDWLLGTTLNAPNQAIDYQVDGISVHRIGLSTGEKLRMAPWLPLYYPLMGVALPQIATLLETHLTPYAQTADLVHNVRIGREGLSAASFRAARRWQIPFVLTPVHHPRWVGWRYRCYLELYRQADGIFALTEAERQTLISLRVQPEKIHVIGHGPIVAKTAAPEAFRTKYGINGPVVLFLGQHYRYKGYGQLLEAATAVWQQRPEVEFVFIGPPVQDSEKAFAAMCDSRVHRLGHVSLQEKTDALAACELLCVPSTQESFGGVYTEAWLFEKPVIGCPIPAVSEVIEAGVDGFLVDQTPSAIADAILMLLADAPLRQSMGASGKAKVNRHYTWSAIGQKAMAAYVQILGESV